MELKLWMCVSDCIIITCKINDYNDNNNNSEEFIYYANYYQGKFPTFNNKADGFEYLAPRNSFIPQNDYNMYNMIGNAWEWVNDRWGTTSYSKDIHYINPKGPLQGTEKVKKGGSFLCHSSYCNRYHTSARTQSTPDSAAMHTGFRCIKVLKEVQ